MTTDPQGGPPEAPAAPAALNRSSPLPPPGPPGTGLQPDRELRPTAAAGGAVVLAAVAWTVWRNSGSRLALFVAAATVAALVIDVMYALVATRRVRLAVTASPAEATVEDTVTMTVSLAGPRQFVRVAPASFAAAGPPPGVDVPGAVRLSGVATSRQILREVLVEVVSQGVGGLVACARRRSVRLPRPLAVGPRPLPVDQPVPELFHFRGEGSGRPAETGDLVRGVRPYLPGDPRRRVHWRATARAGDLVVKEMEEMVAARLLLVVDLGPGGSAGERAAGRAAGYGLEALRRGYELVLATAEGSRLVVEPVRSASQLNWRLAAAAPPGRPKVKVQGAAAGVLHVSPEGDSWL